VNHEFDNPSPKALISTRTDVRLITGYGVFRPHPYGLSRSSQWQRWRNAGQCTVPGTVSNLREWIDVTDGIARTSTGVSGLDEILRGGLIANRSYMIRGGPGTGKTILGLHLLHWAAERGQSSLLLTFGESQAELTRNGAALGFAMERLHFLDLSPDSGHFAEAPDYDIFPPSDVERAPLARRIRDEVTSMRPCRVLIDGMTQLRYLSPNSFQFRKEALAFLRFLAESGCTVAFTSESNEGPDEDLQFIADGVISLESDAGQRRLMVTKFRGSDFRAGYHTLRLSGRGMEVFPRLLPEDFSLPFEPESIPFGLPALDRMLNGGLERGTITILTGPSGVGKTTLGMQFAVAAAARGERAAVYVFEEACASLLRRCEAIGIQAERRLAEGSLSLMQVEPLRYTADEFALMVRDEVEKRRTRVVMIDSVSGYRLSVRDEELVTHLHALSKYLQNMGVAVLLLNEVEAITGDFRITDVGVSYMADNILFLRYLEIRGEMAKALGVLKKRLSDFEKTFREVRITARGIEIGQPLRALRGILSGAPEMADDAALEILAGGEARG
jgi:circadian clock protein KaiC